MHQDLLSISERRIEREDLLDGIGSIKNGKMHRPDEIHGEFWKYLKCDEAVIDILLGALNKYFTRG